MRAISLRLIASAWLLLAALPAMAQNSFETPGGSRVDGKLDMCLTAQGKAVPCTDPTALPIAVAGSFSATLSGFTPGGTFATLTATAASSGSTALPAGVTVAFQNTSSVDVSCVLSAGVATATTNKIVVRGGSTVFVTVGSNVNTACINQTGAASNVVVLAGGAGLGTNFGGGTGGGGGAVFGPTAKGAAAANPPVLVGGTADGGATGNVGVWKVDSSGTGFIDCVTGGTLCTALGNGVGAPGVAPPANVIWMGANGSGATGGLMAGVKTCDLHAIYDASDNGSIELIAAVSGRTVYICGFIMSTGGTATNLKLVDGTGTNCATGTPVNLTPAYQLVANDKIGANAAFWNGLKATGTNRAVCVNASAGNAHQAEVWYTIQ